MPKGIPKASNPELYQATEEQIAQDTQERPKKKGTRPGWKPAGDIPKLKAPPGYTAKWANPEKLTKLRAEGWEIMKPGDNRGEKIYSNDVNDVSSLTGEIRYRDLIAIMLPKELKEARDEWLKNENKEATKAIFKQTDEQLADIGVTTFKPEGQSGRLVIE